jgi:hypothetical protein
MFLVGVMKSFEKRYPKENPITVLLRCLKKSQDEYSGKLLDEFFQRTTESA